MSTAQRLSATARWGRAAITTAVALLLATVAHVSGGGLLPGLGWLLVLSSLTWAISARILDRPASTARIVILVVGAQSAAHVFLSATAGHRGARNSGDAATAPLSDSSTVVGPADQAGQRTGSLRDLTAVGPDLGTDAGAHLALPSWILHLPQELAGPNALMALTHVAAAAALGLWLAMGERSLWALLALVGPTTVDIRDRLRRSLTALACGYLGLTAASTDPLRPGGRQRRGFLTLSAGMPCCLLHANALPRRGPPTMA